MFLILELLIQTIRQAIVDQAYRLSIHVRDRLAERAIEIEELESIVTSGEPIEWEDDPQEPEVLFLGYVREQVPLYVKCAVMTDLTGNAVIIITAHWKDRKKWKTDRERRQYYSLCHLQARRPKSSWDDIASM